MSDYAASSAFPTPAPELHGPDCSCLRCGRCPDCGSEIEERAPFGSFVERMMLAFLTPADRAVAERMVERHCRECGFYEVAER